MSIQMQELIKEVELWRSQKKYLQEHMPKDLKNKILSFQGHQSNREIIRTFNLNNNFFNKRKTNINKKAKTPKASSLKGAFVKLPPLQSIKKPKLIIKLPNGVSMEFFE